MTTLASKVRGHAVGARRYAVVAALLLALMLRALLPSGAMLAASQAEPGTFEMTICSASSPHKVVVADPLNPGPTQDPVPAGHDHNSCGFAATASVAVLPLGVLLPPAFAQLGAVPERRVCDLGVIAAPVGPPLGSRAPPVAA